MARYIDILASPERPAKKRVIVLSYPRNGTLGLYRALQVLGYSPYHFINIFERGIPQINMFSEGLRAKYEGTGKPFGRAEFDKWFEKNDAILDVSAFFAPELVAAYPDAKFILTYREPQSWLKSVHKTLVSQGQARDKMPIWLMRKIEPFTSRFFKLTYQMDDVMWQKSGLTEGPKADELALDSYQKHNELVRELVPKDRLLEVKLEDGLDWEQICPFLGQEIPQEPWPEKNNPDEFNNRVRGYMMQHWATSFLSFAAIWVPVVGFGLWYINR